MIHARDNRTSNRASRWDYLALTGVLLACAGDSSGPDLGLTPAQLTGSWTMVLSDESSHCTGAAAGGPITLHLNVTDADVVRGKVNIVDDWGSPTATFGTITGNVDLNSGSLEIRVWKGVLVNGANLTGKVKKDLSFAGTLIDPFSTYGPIFVFGSCAFDVIGGHD